MNIIINNISESLPDEALSVERLIASKGYKATGTAVAINDVLVPRSDWTTRLLQEGDNVVIISAAFGG